jgi:GT2 family glycosyltransferase
VPDISVVLLSWDGLELTKRCVESLRDGTRSDHEIIIVDNGSQPEVKEAVTRLADRFLLNPENLGFARGMNQGLELVASPHVVFANNDTVFPPGWDTLLVETMESRRDAGLVVPAVTASGNPRTVRSKPGTDVELLLPFTEPPSGIVYLMPTDLCRRLGGWSTEYRIASGEDWDLCFTLWLNGFEIYYDTRVLVEHMSKGTAAEKLGDWRLLWRENRNLFLDKWSGDVSHLVNAKSDLTDQRNEQREVVVDWMRRFYHTRDDLLVVKEELGETRRDVARRDKRIETLKREASLRFQLRAKASRFLRSNLPGDPADSSGPSIDEGH